MNSRGEPDDRKSDRAPSSAPRHGDDDRELSLEEAAAHYQVSKRTLLRALSFGELDAHKARGIRGQEWRVTPTALTRAGYVPREQPTDVDEVRCAGCRRLREQLAVQRRRNSDLANRLGHALLTAGRLRAQLLAAGIQPDSRFLAAPETIYLDQRARETLEGTND